MRIQVLIISLLVSLLAWGGSYRALETGYQVGQRTGVVPNLHIKHRVRKAADFAWDIATP
jgi:hypothetical protein